MIKISKKYFFTISSIIVVLLLQGCATQNVKLNDQDRSHLKSLKSVYAFHVKSGWPTLKTPLGVLASDLTFGLSEDWTEGQKLVTKFKIKDPSRTLTHKFIRQVNHKKKSANFKAVKNPLSYDDIEPEAMTKKYKKGVVLQVLPGTWQIWYYPFSWGKYQMWYRASARLIRLEDSKILWSAACKANQDHDSNSAPTLDELTADNSQVLKTWVNKSTSECAKQLSNDFFGIANI